MNSGAEQGRIGNDIRDAPLASKRRSKPNELVPPPNLSIIHGGGADYPEIGSVLFETTVEAGITGFAIHRAQH